MSLRPRTAEKPIAAGGPQRSRTIDRCRAVTVDKRDAAEDHAARMRNQCSRNADLTKVEEIVADD